MTGVQPFLPLLFATLLALPPVLATGVERVERVLHRVAVVAFGDLVDGARREPAARRQLLRAAHVPTTYRTYAATSILYTVLGAIVGGILGIYAIWGVLRLLAIDRAVLRQALPTVLQPLAVFAGLDTLSELELVAILVACGLTAGLFGGLLTYWFRWWWPEHVARTREQAIEGTMPQAIAFMYALSRSGMALPTLLRITAEHRHVYGEAAAELHVAVRHMQVFGRDMVSAVQQAARTTPSEQFGEFAENLASVLQSGRSLSAFLEAQYGDFQEEAETQQRRILELLSTLAEVYVTLLVSLPLFFITIMVIIGLSGANTIPAIQTFVYFVLPVATLGFVLYLDGVTERFGRREAVAEAPEVGAHLGDVRRSGGDAAGAGGAADGDATDADGRPVASDGGPAANDDGPAAGDGGRAVGAGDRAATASTDTAAAGRDAESASRRAANLERIALHRRVDGLRRRLGRPVRTVVRQPTVLLYVTVPLAILVTALRAGAADELTIRVVDDLLVQGTLFVVGTFAVAHEVHRRRIRAVETAVPDFLDRLASVNEAGLSVVNSIGRVRDSELGALDPEVDRLWRDVQLGADLETALHRFERRLRTRTVSRVVALITNAMHASGDVSRVLRIAANQAKADRRLRQRRRQAMLSYSVVVYITFLVFLVIVGALDAVLIPSLPESNIAPEPGTIEQARTAPGAASALADVGAVDAETLKLVLTHTAIVQGFLSGFVAGQMSGGDLRNGAKHAAILLALAYVAMLVV